MEKHLIDLEDGRRVVVKYDPKKQRLVVGGAKSIYSQIEDVSKIFGIESAPIFHTYGRMKFEKRVTRQQYRDAMIILKDGYSMYPVKSHGRLI